MTRKIIFKKEVNNAAESLVQEERVATVAAIKALLNSNSEPTIHKYLSQWKMACFKNMLQRESQQECEPTIQEVSELERSLKLDLQKQIQRNEEYTQELIQAEKAIVALKEEKDQLQTTNHRFQLELQEVTAIKATLTLVNQEIQSRLEYNKNNNITQQQQLIESLQIELKELNAKSMKAMQELSSSGHEVLMQEKVHSINLQAKNEQLMKELAESHKQLESMKLKAEFQVKVLQRQIKSQQQVLKNYLAPEELNNLSMEEVLTGASYGK
ncbi:MAG: DNA-binding protein [Gammaproteobacteria bacterium]